jgi:hypothetical protein
MGSEVSWKDSGVMSKIPNNLKRIQVSRWFGIVDTPLSHASLHFDALRKELMNSIMPIGGPRSRPGFQVSLQPASPDLEELLAGASMATNLPTEASESETVSALLLGS